MARTKEQPTYEVIGEPNLLGYKYEYNGQKREGVISVSLQNTVYTDRQELGVHLSKGYVNNSGEFRANSGLVLPISIRERLGTALLELDIPVPKKQKKTAYSSINKRIEEEEPTGETEERINNLETGVNQILALLKKKGR